MSIILFLFILLLIQKTERIVQSMFCMFIVQEYWLLPEKKNGAGENKVAKQKTESCLFKSARRGRFVKILTSAHRLKATAAIAHGTQIFDQNQMTLIL